MTLKELNPHVRYVDVRKKIPLYPGFVKAYDHRMFYVIEGEITLKTQNRTDILKVGTIVLLPPAEAYLLENAQKCRMAVINFDPVFVNFDHTPREPDSIEAFCEEDVYCREWCEELPMFLQATDSTEKDIYQLQYIFLKSSNYAYERMSVLLKQILLNTMEDICGEESLLTGKIKKYVLQNMKRKITNQEIGETFSFHPNYLNRIFKADTGMTIHRYVVRKKLEESLFLLRTTDIRVEQIALQLGFENAEYFIRSFRNMYQTTPLQYRKNSSKPMI